MKEAFLSSAARHNILPYMDNKGFAALVATIIVGERRIGRVPADSRGKQILEDIVANTGCVVSGYYLERAWQDRDVGQGIKYLFNQEIPDTEPIRAYASVGIGNMKLPTAANLWNGQACNLFGDCTSVDVGSLQISVGRRGIYNVPNPFELHHCTPGGLVCNDYALSEIQAYSNLAGQLLNDEIAIEYVAAHLEAGAQRAMSLGITPTAFNSVTWYNKSVQSGEEIEEAFSRGLDAPGHAQWVLCNMPKALHSLGGIATNWRLDEAHEPEFYRYPVPGWLDPYCTY